MSADAGGTAPGSATSTRTRWDDVVLMSDDPVTRIEVEEQDNHSDALVDSTGALPWAGPNVDPAARWLRRPVLDRLVDAKIPVTSLTYLAPALRTDEWVRRVLAHLLGLLDGLRADGGGPCACTCWPPPRTWTPWTPACARATGCPPRWSWAR